MLILMTKNKVQNKKIPQVLPTPEGSYPQTEGL